MNTAWSTEVSRIFLVVASALILGLVSGYWLSSVIFHFILYIGWILVQLRSFERWIRNGAHSKHAPDTSGIWALIVQHIYRSQKKNKGRKKTLANLAKRYQAIMKALPDATIVLNEQLEIEWANKMAEELLGVDVNRDTGYRVDNIIRDLAIQELLKSKHSTTQIELTSPVNAQKTLLLNKVKYGDNQTLLTARDISQRIALQKMRKAFIANASHELRTPLTVISGYLEILDSDEDLPTNVSHLINNAHRQAIRMDKILNDLLTLSKLEEKGFSKDEGKAIDVPKLLNSMIFDFKKTKAKGSHEFKTNIEPNLKIKIVEGEMFSLCQNLLSNAIKYSDKGSVINVCWQMNGEGYACLKIADNGEGIAPEHVSRLTERFYRINVSRSRSVGGTGLGLSIVKHIMENCGGYLDIQSELSAGSTFTACFPSYRILSPS